MGGDKFMADALLSCGPILECLQNTKINKDVSSATATELNYVRYIQYEAESCGDFLLTSSLFFG